MTSSLAMRDTMERPTGSLVHFSPCLADGLNRFLYLRPPQFARQVARNVGETKGYSADKWKLICVNIYAKYNWYFRCPCFTTEQGMDHQLNAVTQYYCKIRKSYLFAHGFSIICVKDGDVGEQSGNEWARLRKIITLWAIYTVWKRNDAKFIYLKLHKAVYNFWI